MKRLDSQIPRSGAAVPGRRANGPIRKAFDVGRSAAFLAAAWLHRGPGLGAHLRIARLGAELLLRRPPGLPREYARSLVVAPLDSVRYFEFDFCWRAARNATGRYLDLSSPRALPILLLRASEGLTAELLNPDESDLAVTRALIAACGLQARCTSRGVAIADARFEPASFDLVTALSVIEHIPAHREAVQLLWDAVKPGGQLIVTVPCAREALEEYLDLDEYGLLPADDRGYVFGQRFYDEALLRETFFSACGPPRRLEIFGERRAGLFVEDRAAKNTGLGRPWREPYAVATGYARFTSIGDLPGWGVAAMSFRKG